MIQPPLKDQIIELYNRIEEIRKIKYNDMMEINKSTQRTMLSFVQVRLLADVKAEMESRFLFLKEKP